MPDDLGWSWCNHNRNNHGLVAKSCLTLAIPWTVACQAPLSMGFSRREYWSGLSFSSPGDLPDPGIEPGSPARQADSFTNWAMREDLIEIEHTINVMCLNHLWATTPYPLLQFLENLSSMKPILGAKKFGDCCDHRASKNFISVAGSLTLWNFSPTSWQTCLLLGHLIYFLLPRYNWQILAIWWANVVSAWYQDHWRLCRRELLEIRNSECLLLLLLMLKSETHLILPPHKDWEECTWQSNSHIPSAGGYVDLL